MHLVDEIDLPAAADQLAWLDRFLRRPISRHLINAINTGVRKLLRNEKIQHKLLNTERSYVWRLLNGRILRRISYYGVIKEMSAAMHHPVKYHGGQPHRPGSYCGHNRLCVRECLQGDAQGQSQASGQRGALDEQAGEQDAQIREQGYERNTHCLKEHFCRVLTRPAGTGINHAHRSKQHVTTQSWNQ